MIISGTNTTVEYAIFEEDLQIATGATGCVIRNCTIRGELNIDETCTIQNCIGNNPSGDDINIATGKTVTAKNNCFTDNTHAGSGSYSDGGNRTTLWGTDPVFVDTINFRLHATSPCRNAGDNSVWQGEPDVYDYDGNPITDAGGNIVAMYGIVDIGAIEYQAQANIIAALRKAARVHFLLELDFDGLTKRYAMSDVSVPDPGRKPKFFEGIILQHFEVTTSYNITTQKYSIASIPVTIANKERLQDEETRRRLDCGTGKIYLWCDGLDWPDIERNGLIFSGIIKVEGYNRKAFSFRLEESTKSKLKRLPESTINSDTWPDHRTEGGAGSVAGLFQPLAFGDWPKGLLLRCVDTVNFKYLACTGIPKSTDADYTAEIENVYDKNGSVIDAGNYTFNPVGLDGEGNMVAYFDFTAGQAANEPLSCSIQGLRDNSGEYTGAVGSLIEHPVHIVHYLVREYSLLDTEEIDLESIKTAASFLSGAKFASIINADAATVDIIDRILWQCQCARVPRADGFGIMTFNADPVVIKRIEDADLKSAPVFDWTPKDSLCNSHRVYYALNLITGKYEHEFVRDKTNKEICKKSYHQYGGQPQRELNLPDIRDHSTAFICANRYLFRHAFRHEIVTLEVPYSRGFNILEGDGALLTLEDGSSIDGNGWVKEPCILLDRKFQKNTMLLRFWRISTN